jgi:hypothetical protein
MYIYKTRNKSYEGQFKVQKKKTFIHFIFLESELRALPIISFLTILRDVPHVMECYPLFDVEFVCRWIVHYFIIVNNFVSYSEVPRHNPNPDTCPLYLNPSWFSSIIPGIATIYLKEIVIIASFCILSTSLSQPPYHGTLHNL